MLVITRRRQESFVIDEKIIVTILSMDGDHVRIGIEAPKDVPIRRSELADVSRRAKA